MSAYTVIGATGFIGARVVRRLRAAGAEVYAPARGDPALFERDLGRVFYCAGLTGDYREKPFEAVEAHVSFLARVLQNARYERLVYLSSTRLYDSLGGGDGMEGAALPLRPSDPGHVYELSKALGENLALNQSGGRGSAARVAYVFDWEPGAAGFLSEWLAAARNGRRIDLDSGPSFARDYIHVDDVADGLKAMLDVDGAGLVNLASGRVLSNRDIAAVFAAQGWTVNFSRPADPRPTAKCDVSRLAALGVAARDPLDLIAGYLASLKD
jgi:nucleoside-diphosphate-sugar epimerase